MIDVVTGVIPPSLYSCYLIAYNITLSFPKRLLQKTQLSFLLTIITNRSITCPKTTRNPMPLYISGVMSRRGDWQVANPTLVQCRANPKPPTSKTIVCTVDNLLTKTMVELEINGIVSPAAGSYWVVKSTYALRGAPKNKVTQLWLVW